MSDPAGSQQYTYRSFLSEGRIGTSLMLTHFPFIGAVKLNPFIHPNDQKSHFCSLPFFDICMFQLVAR